MLCFEAETVTHEESAPSSLDTMPAFGPPKAAPKAKAKSTAKSARLRRPAAALQRLANEPPNEAPDVRSEPAQGVRDEPPKRLQKAGFLLELTCRFFFAPLRNFFLADFQ